MRNTILLTCIFLFFQTIHSQYENGYIVTANGENKFGLIKNQNWNNNPERIYFKTNPETPEQVIEISRLTKFGIGNDIKFVISEVDLDLSSDKIGNLTRDKKPIFEKKSIALRKLIEGTISLFEYQFSNGTRFYVKKADGDFEALVFKKYLVSGNRVGINEHYKQQLSLLFSDKSSELQKDLERLSYSRKSLSKIISKYNLLSNSNSISYTEKIRSKAKLHITVFGGLEQTSVSYQFPNVATLNPSFDDISRSILGAELELLVLNNKLGIFSGYSIKSEVSESVVIQTSVEDITQTATLSFNNNTVFFGARGYIPTVKNLNLVINAGITVETVNNFSLTFDLSLIEENFKRNSGSEFFGIGLEYKKVFAEARFFSNRMFAENVSNSVSVDNSNVNFRLGYKIL
ncbi:MULTISPECIES: hypothetical protein [unclassified Allomuricauda]|uniref:hypothetical protein n=1 Tax=unclassified Allomuricauda TaxID=2615049 RepID=UPI00273F22B1|nr:MULTISPECIES: hypothetical protein [unclassified Allomuricauda]